MILTISHLYRGGGDFIRPNVSYVKDTHCVHYNPLLIERGPLLKCTFNATSDNLVAFTGASNIKSLKVNGTPIEFEPIKNEINTFDVLGENISLDMETGAATFPYSYLIKSPVTSWSFKAKDPNYVLNENTYACMLGLMDGETIAEPYPLNEVMGYAFTTNDGVTLELVDTFLAEMNAQIQSGMQVGFTLMDVDTNSGTLVFIDTEHQTNVTTGGLPTYSFDSEGFYDVEIELADSDMKGMQFAETPLISIEIGDGITTIGDYAFQDCYGLTEVTIGKGVTSIGNYTFRGCSSLTSIVVSAGNTVYDSRENCNCLIETATNRLIKGSNNSFIPNGVTEIESNTFTGCYGLTSINIPDSVTSIGSGAFMNCSGLTDITIGSGVKTIGSNVFTYCSSLSEIICKGNIAPQIQNDTFGYQYGNIKKFGVLTVPDNADYSSWMRTDKYYLGYYGWSCPNMPVYDLICTYNVNNTSNSTKLYTSTNFKPYMMIINDEKLNASSNYKFNEIGQHEVIYRFLTPITEIIESTFRSCSGLTSIVIPDSVTSIDSEAFYSCYGLTSIVIPDSVTSIGNLAFGYCSGLTEVTIGSGVTSIGEEAFRGCHRLTGELVIPDSVTTISKRAFYGCSLTGELVIPDSVTSIGNSAFYGCSRLTGVTIGSGLTTISGYTFCECDGLTSIVIPDSVTSIGDGAFYLCKGLTEVTIGSGVTSIGEETFKNCSGLTGITIPDSVTSIGNSAFTSCYGLTSIVIPDSVTSIGDNAFDSCSGLTGELVIPDSVTSIGIYVFANCTGLTSVNIGSGLTIIERGAFYRCSGLTGKLIIPDSVTEIGYSAFYNCTGLTGVTIGSRVTSIGDSAFYGWSLTSIEIPASVTSIKGDAFEGCPLTSITCYATTAPSIESNTFHGTKYGGTLYVPVGSDYSSWMSTSYEYLGYQRWTIEYIS